MRIQPIQENKTKQNKKRKTSKGVESTENVPEKFCQRASSKVNSTTSQGIWRGIGSHNLVHLSIVVDQRSRLLANVSSNVLSRHPEKSKKDRGFGSKTVHRLTIIDAEKGKVLDKSSLNGRGE